MLRHPLPRSTHSSHLRCLLIRAHLLPCPGMHALPADLEAEGHKLPTQMLSLMKLLEKEGPRFSDRLLVTVRGELGGQQLLQWRSIFQE